MEFNSTWLEPKRTMRNFLEMHHWIFYTKEEREREKEKEKVKEKQSEKKQKRSIQWVSVCTTNWCWTTRRRCGDSGREDSHPNYVFIKCNIVYVNIHIALLNTQFFGFSLYNIHTEESFDFIWERASNAFIVCVCVCAKEFISKHVHINTAKKWALLLHILDTLHFTASTWYTHTNWTIVANIKRNAIYRNKTLCRRIYSFCNAFGMIFVLGISKTHNYSHFNIINVFVTSYII